ncbi:MAG: type II toxin-antitoxin system Phd/YefM family antitoxin [Actinobacteria bacterium]|nr:type II toxin-antitoxin system Phd/YefM family antitoxin [Actinomycetota bacterium]
MTPAWDLRKRVDEADFGDAQSVSVKDLRIGLSEIINRVAYGGAQIVVRRHGKPVVAIVPTYDLQACQALEAHSSARVEALKQLADSEREGDMDENCMPWDEVTEKYGPW